MVERGVRRGSRSRRVAAPLPRCPGLGAQLGRGNVHPFVGAGIAAYILQERDGGRNLGDSQSKLGGTVFGGIEIFTSPTVAFKAEGRYHLVPRAFRLDPDGFALTVGLKKYF